MLTTKELISLDNKATSKDEIISQLVDLAYREKKISDLETFKDAIYHREAEFSTALGMSIAMPHGQSDAVKEPFVIFARTAKEISWDQNQVRMIFMIGVPLANRSETHMKIIAALSKKLLDETFRQALLESGKDEAYNLLQI